MPHPRKCKIRCMSFRGNSDLTAASAMRAKGTQDFSESENELMEDVDTLQRAISTASWKPSPQ